MAVWNPRGLFVVLVLVLTIGETTMSVQAQTCTTPPLVPVGATYNGSNPSCKAGATLGTNCPLTCETGYAGNGFTSCQYSVANPLNNAFCNFTAVADPCSNVVSQAIGAGYDPFYYSTYLALSDVEGEYTTNFVTYDRLLPLYPFNAWELSVSFAVSGAPYAVGFCLTPDVTTSGVGLDDEKNPRTGQTDDYEKSGVCLVISFGSNTSLDLYYDGAALQSVSLGGAAAAAYFYQWSTININVIAGGNMSVSFAGNTSVSDTLEYNLDPALYPVGSSATQWSLVIYTANGGKPLQTGEVDLESLTLSVAPWPFFWQLNTAAGPVCSPLSCAVKDFETATGGLGYQSLTVPNLVSGTVVPLACNETLGFFQIGDPYTTCQTGAWSPVVGGGCVSFENITCPAVANCPQSSVGGMCNETCANKVNVLRQCEVVSASANCPVNSNSACFFQGFSTNSDAIVPLPDHTILVENSLQNIIDYITIGNLVPLAQVSSWIFQVEFSISYMVGEMMGFGLCPANLVLTAGTSPFPATTDAYELGFNLVIDTFCQSNDFGCTNTTRGTFVNVYLYYSGVLLTGASLGSVSFDAWTTVAVVSIDNLVSVSFSGNSSAADGSNVIENFYLDPHLYPVGSYSQPWDVVLWALNGNNTETVEVVNVAFSAQVGEWSTPNQTCYTDSHSESHYSDSHSESHASDSHSKSHYSDSRSESHYSDSYSESHASDSRSNSHASDSRSESHQSYSHSKSHASDSHSKSHESESGSLSHQSESESPSMTLLSGPCVPFCQRCSVTGVCRACFFGFSLSSSGLACIPLKVAGPDQPCKFTLDASDIPSATVTGVIVPGQTLVYCVDLSLTGPTLALQANFGYEDASDYGDPQIFNSYVSLRYQIGSQYISNADFDYITVGTGSIFVPSCTLQTFGIIFVTYGSNVPSSALGSDANPPPLPSTAGQQPFQIQVSLLAGECVSPSISSNLWVNPSVEYGSQVIEVVPTVATNILASSTSLSPLQWYFFPILIDGSSSPAVILNASAFSNVTVVTYLFSSVRFEIPPTEYSTDPVGGKNLYGAANVHVYTPWRGIYILGVFYAPQTGSSLEFDQVQLSTTAANCIPVGFTSVCSDASVYTVFNGDQLPGSSPHSPNAALTSPSPSAFTSLVAGGLIYNTSACDASIIDQVVCALAYPPCDSQKFATSICFSWCQAVTAAGCEIKSAIDGGPVSCTDTHFVAPDGPDCFSYPLIATDFGSTSSDPSTLTVVYFDDASSNIVALNTLEPGSQPVTVLKAVDIIAAAHNPPNAKVGTILNLHQDAVIVATVNDILIVFANVGLQYAIAGIAPTSIATLSIPGQMINSLTQIKTGAGGDRVDANGTISYSFFISTSLTSDTVDSDIRNCFLQTTSDFATKFDVTFYCEIVIISQYSSTTTTFFDYSASNVVIAASHSTLAPPPEILSQLTHPVGPFTYILVAATNALDDVNGIEVFVLDPETATIVYWQTIIGTDYVEAFTVDDISGQYLYFVTEEEGHQRISLDGTNRQELPASLVDFNPLELFVSGNPATMAVDLRNSQRLMYWKGSSGKIYAIATAAPSGTQPFVLYTPPNGVVTRRRRRQGGPLTAPASFVLSIEKERVVSPPFYLPFSEKTYTSFTSNFIPATAIAAATVALIVNTIQIMQPLVTGQTSAAVASASQLQAAMVYLILTIQSISFTGLYPVSQPNLVTQFTSDLAWSYFGMHVPWIHIFYRDPSSQPTSATNGRRRILSLAENVARLDANPSDIFIGIMFLLTATLVVFYAIMAVVWLLLRVITLYSGDDNSSEKWFHTRQKLYANTVSMTITFLVLGYAGMAIFSSYQLSLGPGDSWRQKFLFSAAFLIFLFYIMVLPIWNFIKLAPKKPEKLTDSRYRSKYGTLYTPYLFLFRSFQSAVFAKSIIVGIIIGYGQYHNSFAAMIIIAIFEGLWTIVLLASRPYIDKERNMISIFTATNSFVLAAINLGYSSDCNNPNTETALDKSLAWAHVGLGFLAVLASFLSVLWSCYILYNEALKKKDIYRNLAHSNTSTWLWLKKKKNGLNQDDSDGQDTADTQGRREKIVVWDENTVSENVEIDMPTKKLIPMQNVTLPKIIGEKENGAL